MSEVLLIMFAVVVTWCLLIGIAFAVLSWRLDRRNRVSLSNPTLAPVLWLWSPTRAAMMHRRLRNAVQVSRLAVAPATPDDPALSVPRLRDEIETQAVRLDYHVVVAARLARRQRRHALVQLDADIRHMEDLAARLAHLDRRAPSTPASGWNGPATPTDNLARIADQLLLLEAARAEIDDVERTGGLIDADALMSASPPIADLAPTESAATAWVRQPIQTPAPPTPPTSLR